MNRMLHRGKGFTLIELVMVIIIISILSAFTLYPLQNSTALNLAGQAEQIANDIRYAQSLAMTQGQRYRWVKTSSNTYQIQNNSGTAMTLSRGNTTVTLNGSIVFGTFTNLPSSLVNFDGRGTPYSNTSSPGTALTASATIPISSGGFTEIITIAAQSGGVSIS